MREQTFNLPRLLRRPGAEQSRRVAAQLPAPPPQEIRQTMRGNNNHNNNNNTNRGFIVQACVLRGSCRLPLDARVISEWSETRRTGKRRNAERSCQEASDPESPRESYQKPTTLNRQTRSRRISRLDHGKLLLELSHGPAGLWYTLRPEKKHLQRGCTVGRDERRRWRTRGS